jgi:hypothetical protein
MTAQAMDLVRWRDRTWSLVGIDGTGLFDPRDLGIEPRMLHTAAWRGYICTYGVADDALRLERLEIGFDQATQERAVAGNPPLIGRASAQQQGSGSAWLYDGADLPVAFSGGLRIGHGFIRELYVHMGFAPAWKFEEVHELRFEAGRLVSSRDESAEMRRRREEAMKGELAPPRTSGVERITDWIRSTFDRSYRR